MDSKEINLFPMSYCIPDELILDSVPEKSKLISPVSLQGAYLYNHTQQDDYYKSYQGSYFAYSSKKGGWDCLRHYEIMANGCLPIIDLKGVPNGTLHFFPDMATVQNLYVDIVKNGSEMNDELIVRYNEIVKSTLKHLKENCSSSAVAKYVLSKFSFKIEPASHSLLVATPSRAEKILVLTCHSGVNYTRECTLVGLKRLTECVEYPKLPFLYNDFPLDEKKKLYGNGFTYSSRLKPEKDFTEQEIIEKINNKYWDLIIYGKVGPDEFKEGSVPDLPLWDHVKKSYNKDNIAFFYGGDECNDMTTKNKYSDHILNHLQYGKCFVRELRIL